MIPRAVPPRLAPHRSWSTRLAATLLAATVGLGACASAAETPPARPQLVDVDLREYRFDYRPRSFRPGRIAFDVHNRGRLGHQLVLLFVPPEIPSLSGQLRSKTRQVVPTIVALPAREPGGRGTFAVDLAPGRYGFVCFVKDPDGRQHTAKGMSSEFVVKQ